jgi:hypothetical protein
VLDDILFVPDNARNFKYAARLIPDDDALSLVERFVGIARYLEKLGDRPKDLGGARPLDRRHFGGHRGPCPFCRHALTRTHLDRVLGPDRDAYDSTVRLASPAMHAAYVHCAWTA